MTQVTVGIHVHAEPNRLRDTLAAVGRPGRRPLEVLLLPDDPDHPTAHLLEELGHLRQSAGSGGAGPPACFNRLAAETAADVVILLESGAVPAPGALDLLVDTLVADPGMGLAGPSTNQACNDQCAFPGRTAAFEDIAQTAREAEAFFGRRTRTLGPLHSIGDFCLAARRELIEVIGAADEGYDLGPCWEMDYAIRAARAGFRPAWVCAAYVWRAPFTARRQLEETSRFEASRRRYQDSVCALRLRGAREDYEAHCRGEDCEHFAPPELMRLHMPLAGHGPPGAPPNPAPAPVATAAAARVPSGRARPPLVTCIMPTRDRPDYALHAIRLFQAQDYPHRELVIVDDGDGLEHRLPEDPSIRYLRSPSGESIGAKRNRACAVAAGAYIAQWDDDDWYGSRRLSAQLEPLLAGRAQISGLSTPAFFEVADWRFWAVTPALHRQLFVGDVHGGTLVFTRHVWEALARYPDASLAEDAAFLAQARARGAGLERVEGSGLFLYVRHADNAWRFDCGVHVDGSGWRRIAEAPMPAGDRDFYAARSSGAGPPPVDGPLVSCLMPTRDRRPWVAQAIGYFLRQDYPRRELVILDDGEDRIADLVPGDPRIRYVPIERPMILGEKRNLACELAEGEIVAHWDDDDWYAPNRLSYQVEELQRHGAALCGPARVIYFDPAAERAWEYEYADPGRPWIAGNALCYRRELWRENRFPPVAVGEDAAFVWNPRIAAPLVNPDHRFFAALVHAGNTSPKVTGGDCWRPHPLEDVRALLGADYRFYEQGRA